jgi:hypothetical protein
LWLVGAGTFALGDHLLEQSFELLFLDWSHGNLAFWQIARLN